MDESPSYSDDELDWQCLPTWERLHRISTTSKHYKTLEYDRLNPSMPDSLDLALSATYSHEKDFSWNKAQVVKQSQSKSQQVIQHGINASERPVSNNVKPRKRYDNTLNAETPHLDASSRGFSRKPDGSFYKVTPQRKENY